MTEILPYLLMLLMALLLVSAQTLWASVIKGGGVFDGNLPSVVTALATNWKIWAGVFIYIAATLVYFYLLSKTKFFSVQVAMTALSIIFSTVLSVVVFSEKISLVNIIGMFVVFAGILLVVHK